MNRARVFLILGMCGLAMLAVGCGGGSSAKSNTVVTPSSGQNVAAVAVNGGPLGNYANGLFVSVTVCVPASSTCQTIPNVLVDTGSTGLRILGSALTISLTQQNGTGGQPIAECLPFLSGFTWGPVQSADIQIAGEKASAVPIQVISEATFAVPNGCKSFGVQGMDTLDTLGANGLLGVGLFAQDCGPACAQSGAANPGLYYACPSSGCQVTAEALGQQVQNPVAMFASDNNGVIIELPAVSGAEASLSGSLVFGIGTQSNNSMGGATVYTVDQFGNITTNYKGQAYSQSFLDSGSNGYFFLDSSTSGIPDCGAGANGFYCPASTDNLSATNSGANGASGTVNFTVANALSLFTQNDSVFGDLGGPGMNAFDWGLPFFYGRNVFTAIEGKSTPGGTGPYWAY
jgi:hypothetical protein